MAQVQRQNRKLKLLCKNHLREFENLRKQFCIMAY
ncbi:uncharacterized protein G2W53_039887 [Senna tora]|uniref:Uncharacterized protein n=1 Tax=Senna tora TaxID=362788 RepID=A0A834W6I9_9FABA|nr:uncharacterized protein G2W53_039887 [Senna tora]